MADFDFAPDIENYDSAEFKDLEQKMCLQVSGILQKYTLRLHRIAIVCIIIELLCVNAP